MKRKEPFRFEVSPGLFEQHGCKHTPTAKTACGGCYAVALEAIKELSDAGNPVAQKALKTIQEAP